MYKKLVALTITFLMLFTVGCSKSKSKSTKPTSLDFSNVNARYMIASFWPGEWYWINDYQNCGNIMGILKTIDFKVLEKPFEIERDVDGGVNELEIRTDVDLITITFYSGRPVVTYLKDNKEYYCDITNEEYKELYNTVLQYCPEDE